MNDVHVCEDGTVCVSNVPKIGDGVFQVMVRSAIDPCCGPRFVGIWSVVARRQTLAEAEEFKTQFLKDNQFTDANIACDPKEVEAVLCTQR